VATASHQLLTSTRVSMNPASSKRLSPLVESSKSAFHDAKLDFGRCTVLCFEQIQALSSRIVAVQLDL
jgi:hypothetical protein